MRAQIDFTLPFEYSVIPIDYRRGIVSMIKEAIMLSSSKLHSFLYSGQKTKPFCFSAILPDPVYCRRYVEMHGKTLSLHVSSCDDDMLVEIVKGLSAMRTFRLFGLDLEYGAITVRPNRKIEQDTITFQTMSPIVVRNKAGQFLQPKDIDFIEVLSISILKVSNEFGRDCKLEFIATRLQSNRLQHYEHFMPVSSGSVTLHSSPENLQYVYDAGIGAKRSQGFGMLEVM